MDTFYNEILLYHIEVQIFCVIESVFPFLKTGIYKKKKRDCIECTISNKDRGSPLQRAPANDRKYRSPLGFDSAAWKHFLI